MATRTSQYAQIGAGSATRGNSDDLTTCDGHISLCTGYTQSRNNPDLSLPDSWGLISEQFLRDKGSEAAIGSLRRVGEFASDGLHPVNIVRDRLPVYRTEGRIGGVVEQEISRLPDADRTDVRDIEQLFVAFTSIARPQGIANRVDITGSSPATRLMARVLAYGRIDARDVLNSGTLPTLW